MLTAPKVAFAMLLLLAASQSAAQEAHVLRGQVRESAGGAAVAFASVEVEGLGRTVVTDSAGRFILTIASAGTYMLRVERLGYATARVPVTIPRQSALTVELSHSALRLETLNVSADLPSRAAGELATATVIGSDAIRAQTAVSVRGVLELVPGVEIVPPGIDAAQQFAPRTAATSGSNNAAAGGGAGDLASFGTTIIVDGVPRSNNASLQSTGGPRGSGGTRGVDLRSIPASTLERVEVIRGLPSVRYGDLSHGAVIIETKAGVFAPEVRVQYDPHTVSAATLAGFALSSQHTVSAAGDYVQTLTEPGLTADRSRRLAGQVAHRWRAGDADEGALTVDSRLESSTLEDDRPRDVHARPADGSHSRASDIRATSRLRWITAADRRLEITAAYTTGSQRTLGSRDLDRPAVPVTDRLTAGRAFGRFEQGRYTSDFSIDGRPRMAYLRTEWQQPVQTGSLRHTVRAGGEARREWNRGAGYQYDITMPPFGSAVDGINGYIRPRAFTDVPPLTSAALYADDAIEYALGDIGDLRLQVGVRGDLLAAARHGLNWEVQPRAVAELATPLGLRARASAGRVAKLPALPSLYPQPAFFDLINVNWFAPNPAERLAVITTFTEDRINPELRFTTADKYEAALEYLRGRTLISLVAFHEDFNGAIGLLSTPSYLLRERYALSDSTIGTGRPPTIIEPPFAADTVPVLLARPANHVHQRSRGLELMAILPQYEPLRLQLTVTGTIIHTRRQTDQLRYGSPQLLLNMQQLPHVLRIPIWEGAVETANRGLMVYRLIHHRADLGLLLTATAQHNLFDRTHDGGARDTLGFAGYLTRTGDIVRVPEGRRGEPEFADLRLQPSGLAPPTRIGSDSFYSVQLNKTLPHGRFALWAFNVSDERGRYGERQVGRRIYSSVRFGAELFIELPRVFQ